MDGAPPNPFQGGIVGSGLVNTPLVIPDITYVGPTALGPSGPLANVTTIVGQLPTSGGPT